MDAGNADLWQAEIQAVVKSALAAPDADQPVRFTQGLLCALLGVSAKSADFGAKLLQEVLLKQAAAPGAMPDLSALAETIGAAVERGLDLRVEALRVQLLEELRR